MVADAMFAEGVNHLVYHGMPYNPKGSDTIDFFATTYFGPGGSLTPELPALNTYIETVSGIMEKGKTYTDVAVYIPFEDAVMKGAYPPEQQRVWVWGEYEMRYLFPPKETEGYHPLWINHHFLEESDFHDGKLIVGDAAFSCLYVDVDYMDIRALKRLLALAKKGLPVCLKHFPKQPGKMKSKEYEGMLNELSGLKNVSENFTNVIGHPPFIQGDNLPDYWCRQEKNGTYYLFLAQPLSKDLIYPIYSGQSLMKQSEIRELTINLCGKTIHQKIEFKPYQSLMLRITSEGKVEMIDITFVPKEPQVRTREVQKMNF
jgi:hypothetical protein